MGVDVIKSEEKNECLLDQLSAHSMDVDELKQVG